MGFLVGLRASLGVSPGSVAVASKLEQLEPTVRWSLAGQHPKDPQDLLQEQEVQEAHGSQGHPVQDGQG
jgi:hypothetical protein